MNTIAVDDLIGMMAGSNTHGCSDYAIARVTAIHDGSIEAVVTEAQSCHSCWQVGHDSDHTFAAVGEILTFAIPALRPALDTDDFISDVKWIS